ncbi:MAG TPA: CHRD domain-containing protein [Nitrososphaera sp.]
MMIMSIKMTVATIAIVVTIATTAGVVVATTAVSTNSVYAQGPQKIVMNLSGSEEVPAVQTEATGVAEFIPGEDSVAYSVNATNIQGVTAGHIHLGKQGENGPVVVTLFKYDSPMNEVSETGTITADKLEGPLAGKQLSDLAAAGGNGTLYVNIHTEQNPNGEIRGQP